MLFYPMKRLMVLFTTSLLLNIKICFTNEAKNFADPLNGVLTIVHPKLKKENLCSPQNNCAKTPKTHFFLQFVLGWTEAISLRIHKKACFRFKNGPKWQLVLPWTRFRSPFCFSIYFSLFVLCHGQMYFLEHLWSFEIHISTFFKCGYVFTLSKNVECNSILLILNWGDFFRVKITR